MFFQLDSCHCGSSTSTPIILTTTTSTVDPGNTGFLVDWFVLFVCFVCLRLGLLGANQAMKEEL